MSYLFEEIYSDDEKIYLEISELFDKYNISLQNRNKETWLECINGINKGIRNQEKEKVVECILQFTQKDDRILKFIENAYTNYVIKNISNINHMKKALVELNDFFYEVERSIIENRTSYMHKVNIQFIDRIIDSIPFLVIIKNENGKHIKVNKEAREFYGVKEEIKKDNKLDKYNYSELNNLKIESESSKTFCEQVLNKDNEERTLYVIAIPVTINNNEKFTVIIKSDITKFQNNQIENNGENLKNLFKSVPEAIFIHDNTKVIYLNKVAKELFGCEKLQEIIGKDYTNLIKIQNISEDKKSNLNGTEYNIRSAEIVRTCDNRVLKVEFLVEKYLYRDKEIELVVVWDMEYKTKMEELKNRMSEKNDFLNKVLYYSNAKTQFMGTISHELRTPLNIILSALQVMDLYANYGDLEEKCRVYEKYSVVMKQNGYRLLKMINNFMDITQIEDGARKLNFVQGNIVTIVEDVTLAVAAFLKDKGKNIIFDTDVEEKIMIFDKEKIERIVLNLLSNAVKFTGKDANIRVAIHDVGSNIQISVEDNGMGIPEDKKKMIFERFFQLDKTFTRKNEGSGIGLSIVKLLVELHDGTIEVKSKVGIGSEFTVKLPVRKSNKYKNS
ncbi:sensory transduction histidine kinase [Clostridium acetobutylicum DSM 1731]|nr:ATP-binding protein [Clostridium acetobutylicum]AEI31243.1 sensory transduction histidine kinase [Clostridium acetobutylicum DSM 1731]OOM06081.1 sensor histidine kinase TodS [Clostridium acetobutylicum]